MAVLGSSASRLTAGGCRPRRLVRRHADTCKPRHRSCPSDDCRRHLPTHLARLVIASDRNSSAQRQCTALHGHLRRRVAMVAEGSVDAYYEVHVQPWDCLAGMLIVREARGRTNEVHGPLMLAHGGPLLASAPALVLSIQSLTAQS
jgi:3'-phosphoadenosine 5'-phosphosulfate (PAPS) 3'-phosphatase